MKQILVATDFSNCASNAMEYALELASILHFEVCAIHAIHPTEGIDNSIYNAIYIENYYNSKRQALAHWAKSLGDQKAYTQVKVTTLCAVGFLNAVISNHIADHPAELLIMGITGSTGISGIVGSTANMIVSKLKLPTLIVPLESKPSKKPVITLATDFSTELSATDVHILKEVIQAFETDVLHVLNVMDKLDISPAITGERLLKDYFKPVALQFNYISHSSTTDGIMDFVVNNKTDILCVVKHHHNMLYRIFNRSTVNQVMNKSIKAILVLHE